MIPRKSWAPWFVTRAEARAARASPFKDDFVRHFYGACRQIEAEREKAAAQSEEPKP